MKYNKMVILKNSKECLLRNGTEDNGQAVLENFNLTHAETDYLLTYPDENSFDAARESDFLKKKTESDNAIELLAIVDGALAGTAGIDPVGAKDKVRHRADFGVSVAKAYWGLGIGKALMNACIECAKAAGYVQLELSVVADNTKAIAMYEHAGFVEYGRNPKGFNSRIAGFQELVYMRLELA